MDSVVKQPIVIACDKREALAQGSVSSEAIQKHKKTGLLRLRSQ
jgi:hypothetical protein